MDLSKEPARDGMNMRFEYADLSRSRLTRALKPLGELNNGYSQNVADCHQIQEVEAPLTCFVLADKGLLRPDALSQLTLCQPFLFTEFTQKVEKDFSFPLLPDRPLRQLRHRSQHRQPVSRTPKWIICL